MAKRVESVCPYCGVGCGIVMDVVDNRVVKVSGNKKHPSNFGRLCTKGSTCAQAIAVNGRLVQAHVRHPASRDHVPMAIDDAIAETARRLCAIRDEHGPDAIALYVSGQMSTEAQYLANKLAKGFIRTRHIESNSRLCMASAGTGYKLSLGSDAPPGSYQDFDKAGVFFVIGANMADCHPILFLRMLDRVKAGAKLIVVDPRRTATAEKADLFLRICPGTDLALLNGLLHLLVKNGRTDPHFIAAYTQGWEAMPAFLEDYAPDKVAAITGLTEADIRTAADWIGEAPEVMSCWTMGLNQSTHGVWHTNAVCNLHLATGKICRPGSGPFSLTGQPNAMGGREMGYMGPGLPGQRSLMSADDRATTEALWGLAPGSLRAEAGEGTIALFEAMKAGRVKACWIICTNPVATVPHRQIVVDALQAAEFVVTQDAYLDTETNIHADIMLPGALWAEAEGVMVNSERNLTLMAKAVEPPGDALPDWQLIARVAQAMGYEEAFAYRSASEVFDELARAWNPKTGWDLRGANHDRLRGMPLQWPIAATGSDDRNPIRYRNDGVSHAVRQSADGTRPVLAFATESGKAMFFARPHMPSAEMPDENYPFVLNTGRLQHQWHTLTKTGKIATLNKLNPGPFVEINPVDAARLGIGAEATVEIRSRRGRALLPACVTDRVQAGNLFAPFHWNDVFGEDLAVNAVTNDAVDPLSLQPGFKVCAAAIAPVADTRRQNRSADSKEPALPTPVMVPGAAEPSPRVLALSKFLGLDVAQPPVLEQSERVYLQGFLSGLACEGATARGVPTLPASAPLGPQTRLLLDGMLAGLFSRRDGPADAAAPAGGEAPTVKPVITILWASQTGNAEAAAARCADALERAGRSVRLVGMGDYSAADLAGEQTVLIATSTFGDGDPPDNGARLWSAIQADDFPPLGALSFAVLAFGDSSYDQFCGFGRKLDARLADLGARRVLDRVDCEPDEADKAAAWPGLVAAAMTPETTMARNGADASKRGAPSHTHTATRLPSGLVMPTYDRKTPYPSRLVVNRVLNAPGSAKETRQYGFALEGGAPMYEAGDSLGVWPRNCPELVSEIVATLGLRHDAPVEVDGNETTLGAALTNRCEIARITPDFLRWCAQQSTDETLETLLAADKSALTQWAWGRQIVDVLRMAVPRTSAQDFVGVLRKLQPRSYSISSSPKRHPDQVQLTVSTVRYACEGRARKGVSSTFLAERAGADPVPIFVQAAKHFRPPADPDAPMIMVGPGTGIAPFKAFLEERQATGARGRNWLFFGEQRAATDFYYRDEIETWQREMHLTRLDTAFSRDQPEKIYVQDRMRESGAELWQWLDEGAHIYVCGDASRMAKDVDASLRGIVAMHGGLATEDADAYVARMGRERRYVRDVY